MSMGGHHSARPKTHVWLSPLESVVRPLGHFDLDPCGAPGWPTAETTYLLPQDGLALPWFGRVWLNPPYEANLIGKWLRRLADHGRGVALIFARTETDAFFSQVWERATALRFLRGRLHFHHPDGTRAKDNAGAPSVLVGYGHEELAALEAHPHPGHFVPLRYPRSWIIVAEESWTELVRRLIRSRGGPVKLAELYAEIRHHPKAHRNKNWRAKVRQSLARARISKTSRATYGNRTCSAAH